MLGSALLLGCFLAAPVEPVIDAAADEELKVQVRQLVRQLGAPQLAAREKAEEKLLEFGPKILELLPVPTDRTPAEVKQRVGRIRQRLQQAAAEATARASLVTLQGKGMPLSEVLAAIEEQTGNKIVDYRQQFGHEATDPKLDVDFDNTPFWQALDRTLDQATLTVYAYGEQRAVSLIQRADGQQARCGRTSYSGPFRFEPLLIVAQRDLRNLDNASLRLKMEIAWEPRLNPISLKQKMAELKAVDERGRPLPVDDPDAAPEAFAGEDATAVTMVFSFKPPSRDVTKIARLNGTLTVMIPGKIETFTFGDLADARNVERRVAGVTVTLDRVRKNNELWEVRVRVRFDRPGEALASYRGWIFQNEAYLEGPDGKPLDYETLEMTRQTRDEVGIAYLFSAERPLADYKFVYKTPGAIVAKGFQYTIEDIKLP